MWYISTTLVIGLVIGYLSGGTGKWAWEPTWVVEVVIL